MQPGVRGERIAFESQSQDSIDSSPRAGAVDKGKRGTAAPPQLDLAPAQPVAGPSKRRAASPEPAPPRKKAKPTSAPTGKRKRVAWSQAEETVLIDELKRFHERTDCWDTILRRASSRNAAALIVQDTAPTGPSRRHSSYATAMRSKTRRAICARLSNARAWPRRSISCASLRSRACDD